MRNAFAQELAVIAREDESVALLVGDMGNKLFDAFKQAAPGRFYNCGVAEANMTGVAAGMALMGMRPVTYSIAPFAVIRCIEQIRIDLCYHNLPVVVVGTGSGFSYAELGPTHHCCDDIGLLRVFPNMTIICPCDPVEARCALRAALHNEGPVYIRLAKKGEPVIHGRMPDFQIGKAITLKEGKDVCILSTGNAVSLSLAVIAQLEKEGISSGLESFHTIKPFDAEKLEQLFNRYALVATIEEHSLIGGLGSVVAEWLADSASFGKRLVRFGIQDKFLPYVGDQEYARCYHGLTVEEITKKIIKTIEVRQR